MTDLLLSPEDTGDVAATRVIFHQTTDTAVIRLPESPTRRLTAPPPPPLQALRLGDSHPQQTGEIPAWPTGAELVVEGRPTAPEPSRPPGYRGARRASDPPWAWALIGAGLLALGQALAGAIVLAVAW